MLEAFSDAIKTPANISSDIVQHPVIDILLTLNSSVNSVCQSLLAVLEVPPAIMHGSLGEKCCQSMPRVINAPSNAYENGALGGSSVSNSDRPIKGGGGRSLTEYLSTKIISLVVAAGIDFAFVSETIASREASNTIKFP